jgi:hypothetical protein
MASCDLDPKLAHVQVTHVMPYFDKLEAEDRQTEFEQAHDIRRFMYETPFTLDGKPRGAPAHQWKRRTVLTSESEAVVVLKTLYRVLPSRCKYVP